MNGHVEAAKGDHLAAMGDVEVIEGGLLKGGIGGGGGGVADGGDICCTEEVRCACDWAAG